MYLSQKSAAWRKHQKPQNFLDMGQAIQSDNLANKIIHLIMHLLMIKIMLSHCYCSSSFCSHQDLTVYFRKKIKAYEYCVKHRCCTQNNP